MVWYFKNPNLHDQKLNQAIEEGPGGLTTKEFTKRECLYLTLTSLLKQEEIKYQEHYLVEGFEAYAEEEWPFSQPYPIRRFGGISYALIPGPTQFYYKFAEIQVAVHSVTAAASTTNPRCSDRSIQQPVRGNFPQRALEAISNLY